MNELIERKYYEVWDRIRLAIKEDDDDVSEEGILPAAVDGVPIRKLFVCNLANRTTYKDLTAHFCQYGTVESCFLRRNMPKKNFAFVTFSTVEEAMCARIMGEKKKIILHSKHLRVLPADSWHQPDSSENPYRSGRKTSNEFADRNENTESYTTINDNDSCINTLNDDCLIHIFLYLPIVDRIRIERVCKRWQAISKETWTCMQSLDVSHKTWGIPLNETLRVINTSRLRKVLLRCGRFLNHINISNYCHDLSPSALSILGKICGNIKTINVTALTVSASGITSLSDYCSDITKLCLGRTTNSCDNELTGLFIRNKKLQHLELFQTNISGKCLSSLHAESLQKLKLHRCMYIDDRYLVAALSRFKNLKFLSFVDCFGIKYEVINAIGANCHHLKTLELVSQFQRHMVEEFLPITNLLELERLRIGQNTVASDCFLRNLALKCKQLTDIDLRDCKLVTDIGIEALATLPKLEYVTINHLKVAASKGLQKLCNLRRLVCQHCYGLKDEDIAAVVKHSPNLELLDLSGCNQITHKSLDTLAVLVNESTKNKILRIYVGGTIIPVLQTVVHISPFLQIVNIDLSLTGKL